MIGGNKYDTATSKVETQQQQQQVSDNQGVVNNVMKNKNGKESKSKTGANKKGNNGMEVTLTLTEKELENITLDDLKHLLTRWIDIQDRDTISEAARMMYNVLPEYARRDFVPKLQAVTEEKDLELHEAKTSKNDVWRNHPIYNDEKLKKFVLQWWLETKNNKYQDKEKELVILLTTGSLNPIHTGHIDMMNFAKNELEKLENGKYTVIGGFMSPSHDNYVSTKPSYIRSDDRVEMIKLAVEDSNWIECDEWECKQNDFIDYPQVCQEFSKRINSLEFKTRIGEYIGNNSPKLQFSQEHNNNDNKDNSNSNSNEKTWIQKCMSHLTNNNNNNNNNNSEKSTNENAIHLPKMSIFYVCGRDHCDKCRLWNGIYGYNGLVAKTLVVPRPDNKNTKIKNKNNNSKLKGKSKSKSGNCIVVNVPESKMIDDRSSTQVRKYIQNSKGKFKKFEKEMKKTPQKYILHQNVFQYIKNNWDKLYNQLIN